MGSHCMEYGWAGFHNTSDLDLLTRLCLMGYCPIALSGYGSNIVNYCDSRNLLIQQPSTILDNK